MPRIGDDFDSYYSLAYRATPGKAAARKVEVRVKDPRLSVRSRRQFVPKTENTRMEDRVIGALFGNTPRSAFRFAVKSDPPTRTKDKTYLIPLTVQVPIAALTSLRGAGQRLQRRVLGLPGLGIDDRRRERDASRYAAVLDPAADLDRAKKGHFTYTIRWRRCRHRCTWRWGSTTKCRAITRWDSSICRGWPEVMRVDDGALRGLIRQRWRWRSNVAIIGGRYSMTVFHKRWTSTSPYP